MEWVGGKTRKIAIARKGAAKTESQQDEEKEKRKKDLRMSLTLRNTIPIADRGILRRQQAILTSPLPLSHSGGEAAIWAATLAPSQAGANTTFQLWQTHQNNSLFKQCPSLPS